MAGDPKQLDILVVDDEHGPRETLRFLLKLSGYSRVHAVNSGHAALNHLAASGADTWLVLLDMRMPGMAGMEVVRRLAADHAHPLGVIVVTGYPDDEARREFTATASGNVLAAGFLAKPYERADMLAAVRDALERVGERRRAG